MSATISGVGSGFDITGWVSSLVSAKQQSLLTPLKTKLSNLESKNNAISTLKGKYSTLQSALQTFTKTMYNSSSDMWANTKITSSSNSYATATSSGTVSAASIDLEIEQVATATVAKSANGIGISEADIKAAKFTNLANGQAKSGTFTMFLDRKEYQIEIDEADTVKDVMDKIYDVSDGKIQASVSDGKFSIKAYKKEGDSFVIDKNAELSLGAASDKSNLAAALKLHDKDTYTVDGETKEGSWGYTSSYTISTVNTKIAMTDPESGLSGIVFKDKDGNPTEKGEISINGVKFEVNEKTSLNDLISKINGNSDTKVKASYDSLTNKLILTSTETGQSNISLSEKDTNILQVLGLTEVNDDGEEVIAKNSQTLGQNAIAYVNGNKVISTSNKITGESSGIANLSITIKKPTSKYSKDEDDPKSVTLNIEQDNTAVKEALNKFVTAYNDVVETTKSMGSTTGVLSHNTSLNSLLSSMRSVTSMVSQNDGAFSMLAQIGITTSKTDTTKLTIDNNKLDEALTKNLDSVKQLLSDGYVSKEDNGIFDSLLKNVTNFLDTQNGFFAQQATSFESQIKSVNTSIERANTRITKYEQRITDQFNKMDKTISALNSQLSTFGAYFA